MQSIKKIVQKHNINTQNSARENLSFWMSQPAEECVVTVDYLRKQYYGSTQRLQRVARVIQLKDLADLEALGEE
jgi:hypothetical protein